MLTCGAMAVKVHISHISDAVIELPCVVNTETNVSSYNNNIHLQGNTSSSDNNIETQVNKVDGCEKTAHRAPLVFLIRSSSLHASNTLGSFRPLSIAKEGGFAFMPLTCDRGSGGGSSQWGRPIGSM